MFDNFLKMIGFGNNNIADELDSPSDSEKQNIIDSDGIITQDEPELIDIRGARYSGNLGDIHTETIKQKIMNYRQMSLNFYIDDAIDKIINDSIIMENGKIVSLDLSGVEMSDNIKKKIHTEWDELIKIINFNKIAENLFREFYIDGRQYQRILIGDNIKNGIVGFQKLNPMKVKKERLEDSGEIVYKYIDEEDREFEIDHRLVIAINSGKTSTDQQIYISFLDHAFKPLNLLNLVVDALVIYRITRAPERRVFNIDTGRLPPKKAKKYVAETISSLKNSIAFDSATGKITQKTKVMTMLEDFFFPKGNGEKGTTVDTLQGGSQLGEITDIQYLKQDLLRSLKIPISRLDSDKMSSSIFGGNTADIEKEERDFSKFIALLQNQFAQFFIQALKVQLIVKKIINIHEWDDIEYGLMVKWTKDSHFAEMKFQEKLESKIAIAESIEPFIGKYYSNNWVMTKVFGMTDEEIEEEQKLIDEERKSGLIVDDAED